MGKSTPVSVTHGVALTDDVIVEDPAALATTLSGLMSATGRPGHGGQMNLNNVYMGCAVAVHYTVGEQVAESILAVQGSVNPSGGQQPPEALCGLIAEKTALRGRRYVGRMFPPLLHCIAAQIDPQGLLNSQAYTDLNGPWQSYFTALNGAHLPMTVLHNEIPGETTPDPTRVTSIVTRGKASVQRRRMR